MQSTPLDPYSPPTMPQPLEKKGTSLRTWLFAIGVVMIVLSSLTGLGALSGMATSLFPEAIMSSRSKTGDPTLDAAQGKLNQGLINLQKKYFELIFIVSLLTTIAAAAVFAGGISALRSPPCWRELLLFGSIAFMLTELMQLGSYFIVQAESISLLEAFIEEIAQGTQGGLQAAPISLAVKIGYYFAIGMTSLYVLAKMGFCLYAFFFLRREDVMQLYAPPTDLYRAEAV